MNDRSLIPPGWARLGPDMAGKFLFRLFPPVTDYL
jgi:hypothetical protein